MITEISMNRRTKYIKKVIQKKKKNNAKPLHVSDLLKNAWRQGYEAGFEKMFSPLQKSDLTN